VNRQQRRAGKVASNAQQAVSPAALPVLFRGAEEQYKIGNLRKAEQMFRQVLSVDARHSDSLNMLGVIAAQTGRQAQAIELIGKAIRLRDRVTSYHFNLGNVLRNQGKLDEAVASYRRALALDPDFAEAYNNLGLALLIQAKADEAASHFERALALKADYTRAHGNLLLSMIINAAVSADRIDAEARRWNGRIEQSLRTAPRRYRNDPDPERRMRIGYVSPDFRRHSVSYFLEPLLRAHDHTSVEVFCYADVRRPDAVTDRLRGLADHWHVTVPMGDEALAQRILEDRIDILVDLAGHGAQNRLQVFARKPAPVQVTWLGWPHTTGLTAMDYRVVDAVTDPPGDTDAGASEKLVRLERGFLCYGPPAEAPVSARPPCLESGVVTFGSFNHSIKLSSATLDAWAALLGRIPTARLRLKCIGFAEAATRALFQARFAERGVGPERLDLVGYIADVSDHLAAYHQVDIALDPFPYNGTTTTCEALWMGVPVVTLAASDRHAGRVGSSLLGGLGLHQLIAHDIAEYIAIAVALASDRDRLVDLRQNLRAGMAASSLCDGPDFARRFEAAYRDMWRAWCRSVSAR
jgi:protein O-GlcNAc transferase